MSFTPQHLFFDDVEVGQKWLTHGRTITEADIVNFAGLSGDFNPIHIDHEFARTTPFRRPIAHGMLVMAIGSGLGTASPPMRTLAFLSMREWRIAGMVYAGDTVKVRTRVLGKELRGRGKRGEILWHRALVNHALAMRVMLIVDVFDARITSGLRTGWSCLYSAVLTSSFSTTASITTSRSAIALSDCAVLSRPSACTTSAWVARPISTRACSTLTLAATPFSSALGSLSSIITGRPRRTCAPAMPAPISPANPKISPRRTEKLTSRTSGPQLRWRTSSTTSPGWFNPTTRASLIARPTIMPMIVDTETLGTMHSDSEHIPADQFRTGLHIYFDILRSEW